MRLLVTNDDGYGSPGIQALVRAAEELGAVQMIAPDQDRSGVSHAVTLDRPLQLTTLGRNRHKLSGTPVDCVTVGLGSGLTGTPQVILSGINLGANLGSNVIYSGTVAAAREAAHSGRIGIALSLVGGDPEILRSWQEALPGLLNRLITLAKRAGTHLLNLNLPPLPAAEVQGVRVTTLGACSYDDNIELLAGDVPTTEQVLVIGGGTARRSGWANADHLAIEAGYISLTPLQIDTTAYAQLEQLRGWDLDLVEAKVTPSLEDRQEGG